MAKNNGMKVIRNRFIPFKGHRSVMLFGIIFIRKPCRQSNKLIRHKLIHLQQMKEMLVLPFYVWYLVEWLVKLPKYKRKAQRHISFEREAYNHENELNYHMLRDKHSWTKYLTNEKI